MTTYAKHSYAPDDGSVLCGRGGGVGRADEALWLAARSRHCGGWKLSVREGSGEKSGRNRLGPGYGRLLARCVE
jgi:hypothetical protein